MLFQSSIWYFYKAVMHFHFTCIEKKRMENSRKAAILRKEGIKRKRNATKQQMKKLFVSLLEIWETDCAHLA